MKARSKAARRGRPRKAGKREPNGQPQRESVADARAVNVAARMRQHGLTLAQAGDRLAGYEIGRLYQRGLIDLTDVELCDSYVETVARYMAITNPQQPFPKAMDYVATIKGFGGEPSQDQIDRTRRAYARWMEPLQECDGIARMHFHNVVFHDCPPGDRLGQVKDCIAALRRAFR